MRWRNLNIETETDSVWTDFSVSILTRLSRMDSSILIKNSPILILGVSG